MLTNDELAVKIDQVISEARTNIQELHDRLDRIDLNGSAETLRMFGHWLQDHPDFMIREAEAEMRKKGRELAFKWISDTLHLPLLKRIFLWVLSAVAAGFLLEFGTHLYNFQSSLNGMVHHFLGVP